MYAAAKKGHERCVLQLLQHGASVEAMAQVSPVQFQRLLFSGSKIAGILYMEEALMHVVRLLQHGASVEAMAQASPVRARPTLKL